VLTDANRPSKCNADIYAYDYTQCHTNGYDHAYSDDYAYGNCNCNSHCNSYSYRYTISDSYGYGQTNTDCAA
jgi:hypothetical protein